jgi:hypothetical protein
VLRSSLERIAICATSLPGTPENVTFSRTLAIVDPSRKNLIFGSIAAAVLGVLLVVMLIVACRNQDRMKEVVKNFLKLEIRTAAELLLDVWDISGAPVASLWVILGRFASYR